MQRLYLCAALITLSLLPLGNANATKMLHRNVEDLMNLASRVFLGSCTSVSQVQDGDLHYTEYSFVVEDAIKGVTNGAIISIKQFSPGPGASKIPFFPLYKPQTKYLLFLRNDSKLGLTSPIGLGQGAFEISANQSGLLRANNSLGNRGLFHRMSAASPRYASLTQSERKLMTVAGPLNCELFINLIKKIAQ